MARGKLIVDYDGRDHLARQLHDPGRLGVGALGVARRILLRRYEIDVPIKGQLLLSAETLGNLGCSGQPRADLRGKLGLVLDEQAAHIVPLGRFDADRSEHSLQGQAKTSPGLRSGFSSQYQAFPRRIRRAPSSRRRARSRSRYRNPSGS